MMKLQQQRVSNPSPYQKYRTNRGTGPGGSGAHGKGVWCIKPWFVLLSSTSPACVVGLMDYLTLTSFFAVLILADTSAILEERERKGWKVGGMGKNPTAAGGSFLCLSKDNLFF